MVIGVSRTSITPCRQQIKGLVVRGANHLTGLPMCHRRESIGDNALVAISDMLFLMADGKPETFGRAIARYCLESAIGDHCKLNNVNGEECDVILLR